MKSQKSWVQALGIDPGQFNSWMNEAPRHESLTFWCLQRGLIRSSDYFNWAMNHYGLAMIRQDYFQLPANRELWAKIQSVANWGPEMLPLEEWDGTVFLACVEPAEDIQWSFPVQYVLATTQDLKTQWERLNSESTVIMPAATFTPTPAVPTAQTAAESPTTPAPIVVQASPPQPPLPVAEADSSLLKMPLLNLPDNLSPQLMPEPAPPEDAPAGLNLSANTTKKFTLNLGPSEAETAKVTVAEEPSVVAANTQLGVLVSTPEKNKTAGHGAIDSDNLAPATLAAANSEVDAIAFVFQQLKQNFKYSWLFFVQNDHLQLYSWDATVKPNSPHAQDPIDLTQPSLFRIVMRTRMPYHGHVVESPINTGFFRAWGLRQTPPHVTAVPLTSGGHTIAMLLCAGDKPTQADQTLRFTEKMGSTILSYLGKKQAA